MKMVKFNSVDRKKEFYINPTYVVLLVPNEDNTTSIASHYGEFHVGCPIEEAAVSFDGLVKFTSFDNDKLFYINPTYVAEIVPSKDDTSTIISHQGEFNVGLSIDEVAVHLNEGLEKLNNG